MPFSQQNGLRFYTFEIFPRHISQAVFTRRGGVSPRPWDSLNVGGSIGDDIAHVRENRIRSFKALERAPESVHDVWQVHSADVVCAEAPRPLDTQYQKADILLTDNSGVTLFMRFADCTPVLLYDPKNRVVGIVHSGWLGTVRGAAREAVRAMQERYESQPADILTGNFVTGRTGNEILARTLEQAKQEGIMASIYTHPIGFHGHAAGPTIGLWDQQDGVPGQGDYPLYPNTAYSIELYAETPFESWGKDVRISLEEDAFFDGESIWYIDGRQKSLLLVPRQPAVQ
jgi:hypothetical protein